MSTSTGMEQVSKRALRMASYLLALDTLMETPVLAAEGQDEPRQVAGAAVLAAAAGVSSAGQLRLDMSWLRRRTGMNLGLQGVGYNLPRLREALRKVLGVETLRTVGVVGQGLVAEAVCSAIRQGPYFTLVGVDDRPDFVILSGEGPFDKLPAHRGRVVYWANMDVVGLLRLLLAFSVGQPAGGDER